MIRGQDFDVKTARVVHRAIFDPSKTMFKQLRNDRADCTTVRCCLDSCPLLAAKTCTYVPPLGWNACPYGEISGETGPTRRARGIYAWVKSRRDEYPDVDRLGFPSHKLAFVGDYVFLPYAHMTMSEEVPFLARGGFMSQGNCFLPKTAWVVQTVLHLIDFRPHAFMGGEITSYQKEEVPKFIAHVRECDPTMWGELLSARPEYDMPANYVGRKALLKTLNSPIEWTTAGASNGEYKVHWRWDGERVTTCSPHAYSKSWGDVPLQSFTLEGTPTDDADIVVRDNAWVSPKTVFLD